MLKTSGTRNNRTTLTIEATACGGVVLTVGMEKDHLLILSDMLREASAYLADAHTANVKKSKRDQIRLVDVKVARDQFNADCMRAWRIARVHGLHAASLYSHANHRLVRDMISSAKKRGRSRYLQERARMLVDMVDNGATLADAGKRFDLARSTVCRIVKKEKQRQQARLPLSVISPVVL